jgi:hypothetical protein
VIEDRRHISSKEQIERLILTEMDAVSSQGLRKATAAQHLTIDQDAVAVENDEIGFCHCRFSHPNQSIYSRDGQ